jgi:hypothetical protein
LETRWSWCPLTAVDCRNPGVAAEPFDAELCLAAADENPPLRDAAAKRGVPVRII